MKNLGKRVGSFYQLGSTKLYKIGSPNVQLTLLGSAKKRLCSKAPEKHTSSGYVRSNCLRNFCFCSLDNMLYMVIVPIIPKYFRDTDVWGPPISNVTGPDGVLDFDYEGESDYNGYLFASKAFVQLLVNPFSGKIEAAELRYVVRSFSYFLGHIIDRIGYEKPMMFGALFFLSKRVRSSVSQFSRTLPARNWFSLASHLPYQFQNWTPTCI